MRPLVSIVIPCRNEARSIARCLDSIFACGYPPDRLEVIAADGRSSDATRAILSRYPVRVLDNPERITPRALNLAIEAARGDYILRVDAHSILQPGYIETLIEFLEAHPGAWGAGGQMTTEPETPGPFADPIAAVLSHRFGVGNSGFRTLGGLAEPVRVDTVFNCCWRRDAFRRIGLFHEQLVRSQDIELSRRIAQAGGTLWLVPQARTTYFARSTFAAYLRHNWSNGIWSILPAAYTGSLPVRVRHLIPLAFVTALLGGGLLALLTGAGWLPLVPGLPYALVNLAASLQAALRRARPSFLLLLPIAFAGLHIAYGLGSLWGVVRLCRALLRKTAAPIPKPVSTS